MPLDSKETKLGKSDQEAPLSACKNAGVVLMRCCRLKCVPTAISGVEDISKVPGCHLFEKLLQGLASHELTVYLSDFGLFLTQRKGHEPDNFESFNSLKLSFTNIQGLCSNFVECGSFLESNFTDILALYETNLDDSIYSGNFSLKDYLPLI